MREFCDNNLPRCLRALQKQQYGVWCTPYLEMSWFSWCFLLGAVGAEEEAAVEINNTYNSKFMIEHCTAYAD